MIRTALPSDIKIVKEDIKHFYPYGLHVSVCGPSYRFPVYRLHILDDFVDEHHLIDFICIEGFLIDIEDERDMDVARKCIKYFGEKSIFGCTLCKSDAYDDSVIGISGEKIIGDGSLIYKYIDL